MTYKRKLVSLAVALLLVVAAVPIVAENVIAATYYEIGVFDGYTGAAIANARVEIGGYTDYTNSSGWMSVSRPDSSYTAYISASGYVGKSISVNSGNVPYQCFMVPNYYGTGTPTQLYYSDNSWRWYDDRSSGGSTWDGETTRKLERQEEMRKRRISDGDVSYANGRIAITDDEVTARGIAKVWVDYDEITEFRRLEGQNGEAVVRIDEAFLSELRRGKHPIKVEFLGGQYAEFELEV